MIIRQLGTSELGITPLGFGAWAIGGGNWEYAWGSQSDSDSITVIREALEAGANWIDAAAVYGSGHSEEVVARALDGVRPRPYIFTNCSMVWGEDRVISHSLKEKSIRRECEASLRRLQVDVIDLYQVQAPLPDEEIEEGWATMAALRREGKVRYIGVSNFNGSQIDRALAIAPITSLQLRYSLLQPDIASEILALAAEHNIGVLASSPMGSGLLTGAMTRQRINALPVDDWRKNHPDFCEPQVSRNLELVSRLRTIGKRHGRLPSEVAVAWVLKNPAVTAAILGARRPGQFREIAGAVDFQLQPWEVAEIDAFFAFDRRSTRPCSSVPNRLNYNSQIAPSQSIEPRGGP